ncbi:hypothetical protein [Phenylobacterium sp.]|uniref:hypothetical protein n=1 Tax=Phenylobacterium sp. TaxID=1871053 RepID=UPI00391DBFC3
MNLTANDFLGAVFAWANANVERIAVVWPLAGGWEAWAQAEIAGYINATQPAAFVEREAHVYADPGLTADFLVNNPELNDPSDEIVVELKCESFRNWRNFVTGLEIDAYKLNGQMRPDLCGCRKISLGIFFSPESEERLAELPGYTITFTNDGAIGIAALAW